MGTFPCSALKFQENYASKAPDKNTRQEQAAIRKQVHPLCLRNGEIISYTITPEQFGLKSCELSELIGGTPKENAEITRRILTGEETGPKRDVILMNAGMSLYLGIDGITLAEGIEKAKEMIDSGKAYAKLQEFVKATQEA